MNSLHLRLAIFVLRNHQRAIPDEPPNVKKQLSSSAQYCPLVLWNCPRGTTSCLWVRIKRRSIQLALLLPIVFPYFLLSSIRIWRAQNLDSYLYHFTHILEDSITKNMLHSTYAVYLVQINISVIITYTVHLVQINNNERYYMHVENIEDSRIHISWQ